MGVTSIQSAEGVRTITVDRAPGNAWDRQTVLDLGSALVTADADAAARVIVIAATGDTFCSGGEIGGPEPGVDVRVHRQDYAESFIRLDRIIRRLGTPVVARVHGAANAGGLAVVAACDVAVAASTATVATPEVRGGMFPLLAAAMLFPHLSAKRAFALFYSGEPLDAHAAVEAGLFTESVDPGLLDTTVAEWCARLLAADPRAVAIGRRLYWDLADSPASARVELGGEALLELLAPNDAVPDQSYMFGEDAQ